MAAIDEVQLEARIQQLIDDALLLETTREDHSRDLTFGDLRDKSIEEGLWQPGTGFTPEGKEEIFRVLHNLETSCIDDKDRGASILGIVRPFILEYGISKGDMPLISIFGSHYYRGCSASKLVERTQLWERLYKKHNDTVYSSLVDARGDIEKHYALDITQFILGNPNRFRILSEQIGPIQALFSSCVYSILTLLSYKNALLRYKKKQEAEPWNEEDKELFSDESQQLVDRFIRWELKTATIRLLEKYNTLTRQHPTLIAYLDSASSQPN